MTNNRVPKELFTRFVKNSQHFLQKTLFTVGVASEQILPTFIKIIILDVDSKALLRLGAHAWALCPRTERMLFRFLGAQVAIVFLLVNLVPAIVSQGDMRKKNVRTDKSLFRPVPVPRNGARVLLLKAGQCPRSCPDFCTGTDKKLCSD